MKRSDAITAGLSTYFTGIPCKHGHLAERYVSNWTCVDCHAKKCIESQRKWRAANPEKQQEYSKKYAAAHAESTKQWRALNKDRCADNQRKWNAKNRDRRNQLSNDWRIKNKATMIALKAKRRADILSRTPKWLTKDDMWLIKQAYEIAKLRTKVTGIAWQVDHVIPLRGRRVSGLHVPLNLQVVPMTVNLKKGNSYAIG